MVMGVECRMAGVAVATPTFCPFIIIGYTNFDLLVNHIMFWPHQLGKNPPPMVMVKNRVRFNLNLYIFNSWNCHGIHLPSSYAKRRERSQLQQRRIGTM